MFLWLSYRNDEEIGDELLGFKFKQIEEPVIDGSVQIQMMGNREISIEGCQNIIEYDENIIRLNAKKLEIRFLGEQLTLHFLSAEDVIVSGMVKEVHFIEKNGVKL